MLFDRLRSIGPSPVWSYPLVAGLTVLGFVVGFPFSPDVFPDVLIEGAYLAFAALAVIPVRKLKIGVLEVGWQIFVFGRLVDFLDELFAEPQPLVEPYFSGLLMVLSLSITLAGAYALLEEREERLESMADLTQELSLKQEAMSQAPLGITIADVTQADDPLMFVNDGFTELTGTASTRPSAGTADFSRVRGPTPNPSTGCARP